VSTNFDPHLLDYVSRVANALNTAALRECDLGYGVINISSVSFEYEGEADLDISIRVDDFGLMVNVAGLSE
jgi:hypothetical protein